MNRPAQRSRASRAGARIAALACAAALLPAPASRAGDGGFDAAALAAYAQAQGGLDGPRIYAYQGTTYDAPGGKILATLDGYQVARAFRGPRDEPDTWYLVRRAFLLYRAPGSGEVLARYPDVRARTTPAPPLSIARFQLREGRVLTRAISGSRGAVRDISLPEQLSVTREDASWVFRRVLSPPDPQQKPIELTETVFEPAPRGGAPRIRAAMTKVAENWGFLPPGGRHLLHLSWRPVATGADLAPVVRQLLDEEAPGMKSLPGSLAAALQELGLSAFPAPTDATAGLPPGGAAPLADPQGR